MDTIRVSVPALLCLKRHLYTRSLYSATLGLWTNQHLGASR